MRHPDTDMIIEFFKGELPLRQSRKIQEHLDHCGDCRQELDSCTAVGDWLATWSDQPLNEVLLSGIKRNIEVIRSTGFEHLAVNGRSSRPFRPWLRRTAMVALVVLATMIFQTVVWSPLRPTVNLGTIFNLTSPAYAQTIGEALPDTVLVLTVHTETTFSTDRLTGEYKLDDLINHLKPLLREGEIREILLTGPDGEHPVSINLSDLDPLREELGIDEVHVGNGVVGVSSFWSRNMAFFNNRILPMRSPVGDGWPGQDWTLFLRGELDDEGRWFVTGQRSEEGEDAASQAAWSYAFSHSSGDSSSSVWSFVPGAAWSPEQWQSLYFARPERSLLLSLLTESEDLVATINDEGEVLLSRSLLDPDEVEDSLMRLIARVPIESLTILVDDEDDPGTRALELERIAKRVGIRKVTFRETKKR